MGWRDGAFARVWNIQDKGNYSVAKISISGKNKETNQYEMKFEHSFVKLVGTAHELAKNIKIDQNGEVEGGSGVTIKISGCDHETPKKKYPAGANRPSSAIGEWAAKDGGMWYRFANYVIFGFEFPDAPNGNSGGNVKANNVPENVDIDEEELPFM